MQEQRNHEMFPEYEITSHVTGVGEDTIAAIATPLGKGGIGVIRISGADALRVAQRIIKVTQYTSVLEIPGHCCAYGTVWDSGEKIDEAVITVFRAPRSYTGEDVVEIAAHGGVYLLGRILRACVDHGARPAQAGEFTKRAFLNGKLDLTQAEAVVDLIEAGGRQAAQAALSAREGALSKKIRQITKQLTAQAAHLVAWIDYPEEDVEEVQSQTLLQELTICEENLQNLLLTYDAGKVIREGIQVAIVGKPNTGKSTLMNLLAGRQRSIVSDCAGTTRDVVSDTVQVGDLVLHLSDTAGIRSSQDPIEQAGVKLAEDQVKQAQLVLAVFDGSAPLDQNDRRVLEQCKGLECIALVNKNDLPQKLELVPLREVFSRLLEVSAKEDDGAVLLENEIRELFALGKFDSSAAVLSNERQRDTVRRALIDLTEAKEALCGGISFDAICVCIEHAIDCLMEITGEKASEQIVEQVFERFCVGK